MAGNLVVVQSDDQRLWLATPLGAPGGAAALRSFLIAEVTAGNNIRREAAPAAGTAPAAPNAPIMPLDFGNGAPVPGAPASSAPAAAPIGAVPGVAGAQAVAAPDMALSRLGDALESTVAAAVLAGSAAAPAAAPPFDFALAAAPAAVPGGAGAPAVAAPVAPMPPAAQIMAPAAAPVMAMAAEAEAVAGPVAMPTPTGEPEDSKDDDDMTPETRAVFDEIGNVLDIPIPESLKKATKLLAKLTSAKSSADALILATPSSAAMLQSSLKMLKKRTKIVAKTIEELTPAEEPEPPLKKSKKDLTPAEEPEPPRQKKSKTAKSPKEEPAEEPDESHKKTKKEKKAKKEVWA